MLGLFKAKQKFINPSEYTIITRNGDHVYILDNVIHDQVALSSLRSLVCPNSPISSSDLKTIVKATKIVMGEANKRIEKYKTTMIKTADPEEFFNCLWCVERDASQIADIEKYVYYGIAPSSMTRRWIGERLQIEIRHLIDRAYKNVSAKKNFDAIRIAHIDIFRANKKYMDDKSQAKFNQKYKPEKG